MKRYAVLTIILMLFIKTASAYFCPATENIQCEDRHCHAENASGVWLGFSDSNGQSFQQVVNYHDKIGCFYYNQAGDIFEMDNVILNSLIMKPGLGPWEYNDTSAICYILNRCEFVITKE